MASISDFRAQLRQGGARSNQFTIELTFPAGINGANAARAASFLCNATSLPAVTVDDVPVMYRGRPVHFAGERIFSPWNISVINDGDFAVRNALEEWSNKISNFDATNGSVNPADYQVDMRVIQLDRNCARLKSYQFIDAFPMELGQIGLAYDNPSIQVFDVTFQYNYYKPE